MGILAKIIVGGLIGWIASLIGRTSQQMGCIWNVIVGIGGAAMGHWIAREFFDDVVSDRLTMKGLLISLGGAILLILILRTIGILRRNA